MNATLAPAASGLEPYMRSIVETIVREIGPRMPCSEQEAAAARFIADQMGETCDHVDIEPFTCHPGAFLGWIRIDILLVLASVLSYLIAAWLSPDPAVRGWTALGSTVLNAIAWTITYKEFFSYEEFIDSLFPERPSQNVVGRIAARGEPRRIVMFSGHHDSALRFNLIERFRLAGYGIVLFLGIGVLIAWTITVLAAAILAAFSLHPPFLVSMAAWLLVAGLSPLCLLWWFVPPGEGANTVPGAVDNLSAVAVVLGLGKYLKEHPDIIPEGTEIRLISFGCEEAGLRGAYRYVARHEDELRRVPSELVNMDGLQAASRVMIFGVEPTTRTVHSREISERLAMAARSEGIETTVFGVDPKDKIAGMFTGGTDAAAFSKAGLQASSFASLAVRDYGNHYHTSRDTPDRIEPGALANALRTCIAYLSRPA